MLLLEQNVGQALRIVDRVLRHALRPGDPRGDRPSRCAPATRTGTSSDADSSPPPRSMPSSTNPVTSCVWQRSTTTGSRASSRSGSSGRADDLLFTPRGPSVFLANIRRDPRVGLSIDEDPLPYRKLTVRGDGPHRPRPRPRRRVARPLPDDRQALRARRGGRRVRQRHDRPAPRPDRRCHSSATAASRRGGCRSATRTAPASGTAATTSTAPTWPGSPTPAPAARAVVPDP